MKIWSEVHNFLKFFLNARAGGILRILQSDWPSGSGRNFSILPTNPGGILALAA